MRRRGRKRRKEKKEKKKEKKQEMTTLEGFAATNWEKPFIYSPFLKTTETLEPPQDRDWLLVLVLHDHEREGHAVFAEPQVHGQHENGGDNEFENDNVRACRLLEEIGHIIYKVNRRAKKRSKTYSFRIIIFSSQNINAFWNENFGFMVISKCLSTTLPDINIMMTSFKRFTAVCASWSSMMKRDIFMTEEKIKLQKMIFSCITSQMKMASNRLGSLRYLLQTVDRRRHQASRREDLLLPIRSKLDMVVSQVLFDLANNGFCSPCNGQLGGSRRTPPPSGRAVQGFSQYTFLCFNSWLTKASANTFQLRCWNAKHWKRTPKGPWKAWLPTKKGLRRRSFFFCVCVLLCRCLRHIGQMQATSQTPIQTQRSSYPLKTAKPVDFIHPSKKKNKKPRKKRAKKPRTPQKKSNKTTTPPRPHAASRSMSSACSSIDGSRNPKRTLTWPCEGVHNSGEVAKREGRLTSTLKRRGEWPKGEKNLRFLRFLLFFLFFLFFLGGFP